MNLPPIGDQFMQKISKRLPTAMDNAVEMMANNVNERIDRIVQNGPKYNNGKYKNKYGKDHGSVRKRRKFQTAFVDLQMDRQSIKQRQVTKVSTGVRRISFQPVQIRDGLMSDTLFYYHHWGEGMNPRRQLLPDTLGGKGGGVVAKITSGAVDGKNKLDPTDKVPKYMLKESKKAIKDAIMK